MGRNKIGDGGGKVSLFRRSLNKKCGIVEFGRNLNSNGIYFGRTQKNDEKCESIENRTLSIFFCAARRPGRTRFHNNREVGSINYNNRENRERGLYGELIVFAPGCGQKSECAQKS